MAKEEFGGLGFVPGVVRGTRAFSVDSLGRLRGITHDQIWTPGENNAECRRQNAYSWYSTGGVISSGILYGKKQNIVQKMFVSLDDVQYADATRDFEEQKKFEEEEKARKEAEAEAKRLKDEEEQKNHGMDTCDHGFYAYYEGSNDYGESERVSAVIEGYGETVIGTRGFRSMKAKIVALTFGEGVDFTSKKRVRHNYPEVAFFDSFDKMVSEYPSEDGGMGIQPITPETAEDFWTRSK